MTPQIRLAPYDLVGEILALNRQTLEEHRARQPWAFASDMYESHMAPAILRSFQDENGNVQATSREICAAFDGGRFMGYVWFRGASHRGEWAEIAILDIAVLPEVRGQGTGRALVQNVIEMAKVMDQQISLPMSGPGMKLRRGCLPAWVSARKARFSASDPSGSCRPCMRRSLRRGGTGNRPVPSCKASATRRGWRRCSSLSCWRCCLAWQSKHSRSSGYAFFAILLVTCGLRL